MKYIVKDKKILHGEPVIVGTRIPAEKLAVLLQHGYSAETLNSEFPQVEKKVLRGATKEITGLAIAGLKSI